MSRGPNTTSTGRRFDDATVAAVWIKGQASDNPANRKDACGAWMVWGKYGETVQYGWEIDHIKPVAAGGTDDLNNLQPLMWENNRHKSDNWPQWGCKVRG